jgi:plastocyanin
MRPGYLGSLLLMSFLLFPLIGATAEMNPPEMEEETPSSAEESPVAATEKETFNISPTGPFHDIVVLKNMLKLNPDKIVIKAGETIRWTNQDGRKHFLASVPGSGESDELEIFALMEPGNVYQHTFNQPGEYPYFCFIHNQMTGHVTVIEKGS